MSQLESLADELEAIAKGLYAVERQITGRSSERPTHELARCVAHWMIALRRLATSGPAAWAALDAGFPRDAEDEPAPPETPDGPWNMVGELDAMTAFLVGDLVLDKLAHAELVRREAVPVWQVGKERVPTMWPLFMNLLDEELADPMTPHARFLDITLAVARDVLVAHPDPTAWHMPSFSSWGQVQLARPALDPPERIRAALACLQTVNRGLPHPWPHTDYHELLDLLLAIAGRLDAAARRGIRRAYRYAGFESPSLAKMVSETIRLLSIHQSAISALGAVPPSVPPSGRNPL